jgi:hypothetical protein
MLLLKMLRNNCGLERQAGCVGMILKKTGLNGLLHLQMTT